jgi:hypothetical protein
LTIQQVKEGEQNSFFRRGTLASGHMVESRRTPVSRKKFRRQGKYGGKFALEDPYFSRSDDTSTFPLKIIALIGLRRNVLFFSQEIEGSVKKKPERQIWLVAQ